MPNPLMGGFRPPMARQNPMQMLQQLKSNPGGFLRGMGYNVPEEMLGNPMSIVQHLAQSGQFNQQQMQTYNQAMQQMQNGGNQTQGK